MFLLLDLNPALLTANGDAEFYPWVLPFPEAMMWISNHTRRILGNVSLRMLPLTIVEFDSPLELISFMSFILFLFFLISSSHLQKGLHLVQSRSRAGNP